MWRNYSAMLGLAVLMALPGEAVVQNSPANGGPAAGHELLGSWDLIAMISGGDDITKGGVTQAGDVRRYTFRADRTFVVTMGKAVVDSGTWSTDTTVLPKILDHVSYVDGKPRPLIFGIYETAGDSLKIAMIPPTPDERRLTRFESKPADGTRILVLRRAPR